MSNNQIKPYSLRLEPALKTELEKIAQDNGRSLNTEIAIRLKASILNPDEQFLDQIDLNEPNAMKRLEAIVDRIMQKKIDNH